MNVVIAQDPAFPFSFARAPVPALISALASGGPLGFITELVRGDKLWDLGFRGDRVDIYRGRCVVLQIQADLDGQLGLTVDSPKFVKAGFDVAWKRARDAVDYKDAVPAIGDYLKTVSRAVNASFTSGEAVYHGALAHHQLPSTPGVIVVDRHSLLAWDGTTVDREAQLKRPRHSYERLAGGSVGKEADALATSADGSTLFVVEVKSDAKLIEKAVGQVCWYATLFRWWVARDPRLASQAIEALATARQALGLAPRLDGGVKIERVVPVIALPRSASTPSSSALAEANRRLVGAPGHDGTEPLIWEVETKMIRS